MNSVVFALAGPETLHETDELLASAEHLLAASASPGAWKQIPSDTWVLFRNTTQATPTQGWKLHISATPLSAPGVVSAVLPILFDSGCSFKMVRSKRTLTHLNQAHSPRAAAGKFITIYPSDEARAVSLAAACHEATLGLKGPLILSDRRYRPDSLVHYRYGSFVRQTVFDSDATMVHVIRDPHGRAVPDRREAWFSPPAWVKDPFWEDVGDDGSEEAPTQVLLNERYEVRQALRHANKGGVYLAIDHWSGEEVIIKEARPHVGVDRFGRDAIDRLRTEAANLERLKGGEVAPLPIEMFAADGHHFLALEKLDGTNLRQFRRQRGALPDAEAVALATSIASLLEMCHEAGMLVRDFNPNNLIILPSGAPRVVDLEMACREGETRPIGISEFTPGYTSPEHRRGEVPGRTDDFFSLAATLFFLATSRDPFWVEDTPSGRTQRERCDEQLREMLRLGLVPRALGAPILGGMAENPEERWSPARVVHHLATPSDVATATFARVEEGSYLPEKPRRWTAVTRDLVALALKTIDTRQSRPVSSTCAGQLFDPCTVQYGTAGVGMFLLLALDSTDGQGRETLAELARWQAENLRDVAGRPQGLYFGLAGAAWFLLDAAEALGNPELLSSACEAALSLRSDPARFDITHGASGIGMTLLRFHRATGKEEFLEAARAAADQVLAAARDHPAGVIWPQADANGKLSTFYGFAHGVAGIAYFLLAVHAATGDEHYLEAAEAAGDTLVHAAVIEEGYALWPHGPDRPTLWTYWCNGSSGVGTALARLYQVTGRERYRELAEMAALAVYRDRWYSGLGQCHGLAGNGEFLLDLHRILGDDTYLRMAGELADVLFTYRIYRNGRVAFADDSQAVVSLDFGVGTSGIGAYFHRLVTGRGRLFMVDDIIEDRLGCATATALDLLSA